MRRCGYSKRVKSLAGIEKVQSQPLRQRPAARPLICAQKQHGAGPQGGAGLPWPLSGASMKISIPSRASSLLQPGGVRVVGEGSDNPTKPSEAGISR
jgi:hypothetical protein